MTLPVKDAFGFFVCIACVKYDSGAVIETIHPAGFETVERCVAPEGEEAVLWFAVRGSLKEIEGKASIQDQLDTAVYLGFNRRAIWLEPGTRLARPAADKSVRELMGYGG